MLQITYVVVYVLWLFWQSSDFQWHSVYVCSLFYTIVSCCTFSVFLLQAPTVLFVRCFNASCVYVFWTFLDPLYKVSCSIFWLNLVIMPAKPCELVTDVSCKTLHTWLYSSVLRAFITLTTPKFWPSCSNKGGHSHIWCSFGLGCRLKFLTIYFPAWLWTALQKRLLTAWLHCISFINRLTTHTFCPWPDNVWKNA